MRHEELRAGLAEVRLTNLESEGATGAGVAVAEALRLLMARLGAAPLPSAKRVCDLDIWAAERALEIAFPSSYRVFLRMYGAARLAHGEVFGLSRRRLRGDVVMENQLANPARQDGWVKFARGWGGREYYFAATPRWSDGEHSVVVPCAGVACDFLHFLRLIEGKGT
jgi:hypothetical protein